MIDHKEALKVANKVRRRYDRGDLTEPLSCKCGICSASLSEALRRAKIKHTIHYANDGPWGHVFIVVDGWLLDLTAKQFNSKEATIVFRKFRGKRETKWYWKTKYTFTKAQELVHFQINNKWPREQIHPRIGRSVSA